MSNPINGYPVWYELMSSDPEAAKAFYTDVVGWNIIPWEGGGDMDYAMWAVGDRGIGGVMQLPEEAKAMGAPPHWLAYVAVEDVDATVAKATELGGRTYVEPTDIPNVGRFSVVADPQGAAFALHQNMTA